MNKNYLIVANGEFLPSEMIQDCARDKIIIALDGAVDRLTKINISPSIILGDFDSISESSRTFWGIQETFNQITDDSLVYSGSFGVTIVPKKNQNFTELVKSIQYCDTQGADAIDIVCAMGRRTDHIISNVRALKSEYKKERPLKIHTEKETLIYVKNSTIIIHGNPADYCGIFGFPSAKFSSKGLKYNGDVYPLMLGESESSSNELLTPEASINIEGEALLVAPGQLPSHQKFKKLSYDEIMEIVLFETKYGRE